MFSRINFVENIALNFTNKYTESKNTYHTFKKIQQ